MGMYDSETLEDLYEKITNMTTEKHLYLYSEALKKKNKKNKTGDN